MPSILPRASDARPYEALARFALIIVSAAVTAAALQGCRGLPCDPGTPFQDTALARTLRRNVEHRYPPSLRAAHRTVLSVRGREFVYTAHLDVRPSGQIRLVAVTELGNTLFEIRRDANGLARVQRNPARLPRRWLTEGAARDVFVLHRKRPMPDAVLVRHEGNVIALAADLPGGTREEFQFHAASRRLVRYLLSRRGRRIYEMAFSNEALFPNWPHPSPRSIDIVDHRLRYRATIQVVTFRPHQESGQ